MGRETKIGWPFKKIMALFGGFLFILLLVELLPGSILGEELLLSDISKNITWSGGKLEVNTGAQWIEIEEEGILEIPDHTYRFTISWEADVNQLYHSGDYFTFTVPEAFANVIYDLVTTNGENVGTLKVDEKGNGTATFNEGVEGLSEVSGTLSFEGTYSVVTADPSLNWEFKFSNHESYVYTAMSPDEPEVEDPVDGSEESDIEATDDGDIEIETEEPNHGVTEPEMKLPKVSRAEVVNNRSEDFKIDELTIMVNGTPITNGLDITTYINPPKISVNLKWSQINEDSYFIGGDFIVFDILEVTGTTGVKWTNLTTEIPLKIYDEAYNEVVLGVGSLIVESVTENTVKLSYKVTFTDAIEGMYEIAGDFAGGSDIGGLSVGDKVTFKTMIDGDAQLNWTMQIIGTPSTSTGWVFSTGNDTSKGSVGQDNTNKTIRWRIYSRDLVTNQFEDYANRDNTEYLQPKYENIIFVDKLDIHQTFDLSNLELRMPIFLMDREDRAKNGFYPAVVFQNWVDDKKFLAALTKITSESNIGENSDIEEYVRATPRTYTILVEEDLNNPGYTTEKLIINFGAPGSTGLRYAELMKGGIVGEERLTDAEKTYGTYAYALNQIKKYRDISGYVINNLGGEDMPGKMVLTHEGYSFYWEDWQRYYRLLSDSYDYYNVWEEGKLVGPYIYGFEVDIVAKVKTDQIETLKVDKVSNSVEISGAYGPVKSSADYANFWSANISAKPGNREIQIFKADSLYENPESITSTTAILGHIGEVEFEVYKHDGTGPLKFNISSGKFIYNTNGAYSKVTTKSLDGSLILSGLSAGETYYLKEVAAPEGYYGGQNQKIEFTVINNVVTYKLVTNNPRGISLTKVDGDDSKITLAGATFELYKYTDKIENAKEVTGFTLEKINGIDYLVYDGTGTDALITGNDGKLNVVYLPAGNYYLKETSAPKGYQLLGEIYTFVLGEEFKEITLANQVNQDIKVDFNFIKVDESDGETPLSGAEFQLYYEEEGDKYFYNIDDNENITWVNEVAVKSLKTESDGKINIKDLKPGIYQLIEITSPKGFQLPSGHWQIEVDSEGEINIKQIAGANGMRPPAITFDDDTNGYLLVNIRKPVLPSTGGIGTYGFTATGCILFAIALMKWKTEKKNKDDSE